MKKYVYLIVTILLILSSCSDLENMNNEPPINQSVASAMSDSATLNTNELSFTKETTTIVQEELDYIDENVSCIHCPASEVLTYHSFDYEFIKYVGEDAFYEWYNNAFEISESINDPNCRNSYVNIYNFIKDFNIPKDEFEKLLYKGTAYYIHDYDLDILYSEDAERIDEYYCTEYDRILEIRKKRNELSFKINLFSYVERNNASETYEKWIMKKDDYNEDIGILYQWSIPEIIIKFEIPREFVEQNTISTNPNNPMYSYNLDKIYSKEKSLTNMLETANDVSDYRKIDESLRMDYIEAEIDN